MEMSILILLIIAGACLGAGIVVILFAWAFGQIIGEHFGWF